MAPAGLDHDTDDVKQPDGWRFIYDFWFPAGLANANLETHQRMHTWWLRGGATAELLQFAPLVEAAARGIWSGGPSSLSDGFR